MITALTVSNRGPARRYEGIEQATYEAGTFASAADVQAAWFASVALVRTPWFFWLDDDDVLPDDYASVMQECMAAGAEIAYTDELVVEGGATRTRVAAPYSRAAHLARPTMLHHLVLCRTGEARDAIERLPKGHYWPEMMLFWELAKRGAAYIPRIGYHWHRGQGLHRKWWTTYGVVQSQLWCKGH